MTNNKLRNVSQKLVDKLGLIHNDPVYQSIWALADSMDIGKDCEIILAY